ncbi:MAG: peroxidase family protein [Planctomycetota bacterium]
MPILIRSVRRLPLALQAAAVATLLTACGAPTDTLRPATLSMSPRVVDASASAPCVIRGMDFGDGPVSVRLIDHDGRIVGPVRTTEPSADGHQLAMLTAILPELEDDTWVRVQIQTADGRIACTDENVLVKAGVEAPRLIDGRETNPSDAAMGSTGIGLRRDVPPAFADGVATLARPEQKNPRTISNTLVAQPAALPPVTGAVPSDLFWCFGQFLDHDLDLSPESESGERADVAIPAGDPWFDPFATGAVVLPFKRSAALTGSGDGPGDPRRPMNAITAWIDGSNVYGSDPERARALRTLDGTGRLRVDAEGFLPLNTEGFPNAPTPHDPTLFLAGDVRANEQVGLTALHTIFVREHNLVADELRAANPHLSGDEIYEAARRFVGAELQAIAYEEFLPTLLGEGALPPYAGLRTDEDASIGVLFSTAAFRLGHTMVGGTILRLTRYGTPLAEGHLSLRDAFFQPQILRTEGGVDPVLRGLAANPAQAIDPFIVDDLRNFLFGPPGAGGLDLAALNIQRGRDHGLPSYNACRVAYGLAPRASFDEVTSNPEVRTRLAACWDSPDVADPWPVLLAEDRAPLSLVGETLTTVLADQFRRVRDADRCWYERIYLGETLARLKATRLADVIRRTTTIRNEISSTAMLVPEVGAASTKGAVRESTRSAAELGKVALALAK